MKYFFLFFFSMMIFAQSKEIMIFATGHTVSLSNDEKSNQDFYINAGTNKGLERGNLVEIERKQPLYDQYTNSVVGDLKIPVGEIVLIHVQTDVSVARPIQIYSRQQRPLLEYSNIMVGDRLNLQKVKKGNFLHLLPEEKDQKGNLTSSLPFPESKKNESGLEGQKIKEEIGQQESHRGAQQSLVGESLDSLPKREIAKISDSKSKTIPQKEDEKPSSFPPGIQENSVNSTEVPLLR